MTRSIRFVEAEDEENMVDKEQLSEKTGAEVKKNDVKDCIELGSLLCV